ncbi:NAD(P)/FAD-dependent oxidoreductase [Pigmentiphaga daeguensis]|uniref:FAD-dependent oxidoreductase n=1 Tax=Pigmentiphaga daeguensis TaxID=414049 RepID=A0ABN1BP50_9BURK
MSPSNDASAPLVIVGAGQAGAMAARALRELGHAGKVVLIGDEPHAPYERPPLSKAVLADEQPPDVNLLPEPFLAQSGIVLQPGRRVVRLDAARRELHLDDGAVQAYRACLLATGGDVRVLPALPPGTPGVHYLRTLDDAQRLRAALRTARSLLVTGGGFLGLEIASTARALGLDVTVMELGPALLGRAMPPEVSRWLAARARAHGVRLHLGAQPSGLVPVAGGIAATLADAGVLRADLAVVAVGQVPNVALAREAGLLIDAGNGGIRVDERCRTSAEGVYAAGDCASGRDAATGTHRRLESWQNANEQARIAAAAMLGQDAEPPPPPWFWTDQFGCNIQMLGHGAPGLAYRLRGQFPEGRDPGKAMLFGIEGGRLVHVIAINAGGDLRAFRSVLGRPLACAPEALADPGIPAKQLARLALGPASA